MQSSSLCCKEIEVQVKLFPARMAVLDSFVRLSTLKGQIISVLFKFFPEEKEEGMFQGHFRRLPKSGASPPRGTIGRRTKGAVSSVISPLSREVKHSKPDLTMT